jgi:hypothetical protein
MTIVPRTWLALYTDATAFSLWLYIHNRRYNVSPYEPPDSRGLTGMLMSVIAAPLYAGQLCSTILRRPAKFVVTPKGASSSCDGLRTFRNHLGWLALLAAVIGVSYIRDYASPAALLWPCTTLAVCLTPVLLWRAAPWLVQQTPSGSTTVTARTGHLAPHHAGDITMEIPKARAHTSRPFEVDQPPPPPADHHPLDLPAQRTEASAHTSTPQATDRTAS